MANLKEIRNRISSVSSTMQITNAMKMVSAAKLKKAQDSIVSMRPYSEKISDLIDKLVSFSEETLSNPFFSNINFPLDSTYLLWIYIGKVFNFNFM